MVKKIIKWVLVALFVLLAIGWMPSLSSVFYLLAAVVLLPIPKFEEVLEKVKLKYPIRIVVAVICFVIAFAVSPEKAPATAAKEAAQKQSESNSKNDYKKDDDKKDAVKKQILDTWSDKEAAIEAYYTFNDR
ncbi:MAG: hypothetical protein J6Y89_04465 [Lachnospiraceae bacterium]|nr:hypothetical protein [Lachnospiraceae bacterium]